MSLLNLPNNSSNLIALVFALMFIELMQHSACGSIAPTAVIQDLQYFGSHYIRLSSVSLDNTIDFGTSPKIYERPLNKIYYKIKSSTIILSSYKCLSVGWFGLKLDASMSTDPTTSVNVTINSTLNSRFQIVGVSVIILTNPLDTVMKFYEFDMNIRDKWHDLPYTKPALLTLYTFIRSMSQRINCPNYFSLSILISTSSSSILRLAFDSDCVHDSISVGDPYNVQAVVIVLDRTRLASTPQLNFFTNDHYPLNSNVFGCCHQFNINIAKYGRDINKKCILGFPFFDYIRVNKPFFLFDLDPLNGPINTMQNTYSLYGNFHSWCFQDRLCPLSHPFKKLSDKINCWDCDGGIIRSNYIQIIIGQNAVPNCNTYDNLFASIKYDPLTGEPLDYCLKCTDCEDHFYADNGECKQCHHHFQNCLTCSEMVTCLTCQVGFSLDPASNCMPCNFFLSNCQECHNRFTCTKCQKGTFLENNNCTKCEEKIEFCASCLSATFCQECRHPFIVNADQSGCRCLKGRVLTQTCSEVSGCISSHQVNTATLCYACDTQNNWNFLSQFSCACQKGYTKLNETYCEVSCGDGFWTEEEECDDGNFLNGDGCSFKCLKEDSFECTNMYLRLSICRYTPQITTSIYSISRRFGMSQLTLKISFKPYHSIIIANNWLQNVFVNSSQITFDSHEFEDDSLLVLHYNIQKSVEKQTLKWTLSYDMDKFLSQSTSHQMEMRGTNAPFTYEPYYKHERIIEVASYIVGAIAFVIAVVSIVKADSNIAFETVTTVLFVFYARILSHQCNPAILYSLSGLRIAQGFNEFFPDEHRDYLEYVMKNRFFMKSDLSLMSLSTLSFLSLILLLKVIFYVKSFCSLVFSNKFSLNKATDSETKEWKVFKLFSRAYNGYESFEKNCFRPVMIILFYRVFCTFAGFEDSAHRYPAYFSWAISTTITLTFFVIVIYYLAVGASIISAMLNKLKAADCGITTLSQKANFAQPQQSNFYSDLYITYLSGTAVIIFFIIDLRTQTSYIPQAIETCFALLLLYTIFLIFYRPYVKIFNMAAVVLNQLAKMAFLAFLFLIEKKLLSELWILIGTYTTLIILLVLQVISIYRIKLSWTQTNTAQKQTQELNQAFKQKEKNNESKQERIHNNRKEPKGRKKLWINFEQNMYLYENIIKKEKEQAIKKQQLSMNLYQQMMSKDNRDLNNTFLSNEYKDQWGVLDNIKDSILLEEQKTDSRSELERIKQSIRMSRMINRPKQEFFRRK